VSETNNKTLLKCLRMLRFCVCFFEMQSLEETWNSKSVDPLNYAWELKWFLGFRFNWDAVYVTVSRSCDLTNYNLRLNDHRICVMCPSKHKYGCRGDTNRQLQMCRYWPWAICEALAGVVFRWETNARNMGTRDSWMLVFLFSCWAPLSSCFAI
jgi:hypothetical protein